MVLSLQAGRQQQAGACQADIVGYGGAAGGGKTDWLLKSAARHHSVSGYVAKIFRRTYPQIAGGGGMWDRTHDIYPHLGGSANHGELEYTFPSSAKVGFSHLQHEKDKLNHQGKEYAFIGIDEVDQFLWSMIWYLFSRNRNTCGVRSVMYWTFNPNPTHELKAFIRWWLDEEGRFPDLSKAGVTRWFVRDAKERTLWHDEDAEEFWQFVRDKRTYDDPNFKPVSFAFVPASIDDNPALLSKDPTYKSKLLSLPHIERQRLLYGDWLTMPAAGLYFKREWWQIAHRLPKEGFKRIIRAWDLAGSRKAKAGQQSKLDYVAGPLCGFTHDGGMMILDLKHFKGTPAEVRANVKATAEADREQWGSVTQLIPQDPAQAGSDQADQYARMLVGHKVKFHRPTGSKITRIEGYSAAVENGLVYLLYAPWNEALILEHEQFPDGEHDDIVDPCGDAFNEVHGGKKSGFVKV